MDIYKALKIVEELNLKRPQSMRDMTASEIHAFIPHGGGCGPGAVGDKLVPDRIWGLNVKPCCVIHDFMCAEAEQAEDQNMQDIADITFLFNLIVMILKKGGWLKSPRLHTAISYFIAVYEFGADYKD